MRQKMQHFMMGRYGADQLGQVYLGISMVFLVISLFSRWDIFYVLALGMMGYEYYRMLSRKVEKRYQENQKFMNWRYGLAVKKNRRKELAQQRKIYHFYKCPSCRQKVRVPKGKGKICITCPKCKTEFIKKS
ncbi:hypothetical protein C805_01167 [Eubacterium sp. 14-2]|uniref:hypothetical protein n=1 Tax=Eubacterium sp. 14-2 TaxID=1235790 RepID=UPI00033C2431|nr:hypothetical protein [Eubacterium sp. 14-2]EOT27063.1 hypothetical protein C805_01167 [Eubacterium sp. 14-2]